MTKQKAKIKKSIKRRFKVTKNGAVMHRSSFRRHLRAKKKKSRLRRLNKLKRSPKNIAQKIKKLMGK